MKLLLGIDIGTTATKVTLIDNQGNIVAEVQKGCNLISKYSTWAEEDATIWWNNVCDCVSMIIDKKDINPKDIVSIGVSGMVPTLILLDSNYDLIRYSIQQNDARATKEIELFKKNLDNEFVFNNTGSVISQQSIGPKILWIKNNEPENFKKIKYVMGSYDYIVFKLTGKISVEKNWALESGMFDINKHCWISDIVKLTGLHIACFPNVVESTQIVGCVNEIASKSTSLPVGIPVIGGSADHVSSAFSAGIKEAGDLLIKLGGAGDILLSLDSLKLNKQLFMDYHLIPNRYLLNGCMASSGSLIKWFQKEFSENFSFQELDNIASTIDAGSNGLFVLPYFLGEKTPIFDPYARGVFLGVSLLHTRAHFFHAILEGISYGFLHHIRIIEGMGETIKKVRVTNGGAKSFLWKQITADVVGHPLEIVDKHPGSSLGVAFIAGIETSVFSSWSEIEQYIKIKSVIYPDYEKTKKYNQLFDIYQKIYSNNKNLFHEINSK